MPTLTWGRIATAAAALLIGCADGGERSLTGISDEAAAKPSGGGSASGPTVSAATPPFAHRGEVLTVTITGSGYDATSTPSWERGGVVDPRIEVRATRLVTSGKLEADIAVAADAELALYNVAVTNTTATGGKKKGIGVEMFEVTTASDVGTLGGTTHIWSVSDAAPYSTADFVAAGYSYSGTTSHAVVWTPTHGLRSLGAGSAAAVDAAGTAVVGTANGVSAVRWLTWGSGGVTSTAEALPYPAWGSGVPRAVDLGSGPDGSLLHVGGQITRRVSKRSTVDHLALWTRGGTGEWSINGWGIDTLTVPAGFAMNFIEDVSDNGRVIATMRLASGAARPYLWTDVRSAQPLPFPPGYDGAHAIGISDDGTLIVGQLAAGGPVLWAEETGWTLVLLPASCAGWAWDVARTPAGITITGKVCERPTRWTLPEGVLGPIQREELGGLGNRSTVGSGYGVNSRGWIGGRSNDRGAYWMP